MIAFLLATMLAHGAEEAAPTSAFEWNDLLNRVGGTYSAQVVGPSLSKLNGDRNDGRGHYTSLRQYLSLDFEIAKKWELDTGWEVRQYWRAPDQRNPNRKNFEMRDPYVGFTRKEIFKGDYFSVGTKARYTIPATEYNKSKVGRSDDSGNGEINFGLSPYWHWLDGDLSLSWSTDFYYKLREGASAEYEKYSVRMKPLVTYRIAAKYSARVEYQTGYLRRMSNGRWSKLNDVSTGQKIYAGVSWFPTKALMISPSLGWGSETFRLDRTEIGLFASFAFL